MENNSKLNMETAGDCELLDSTTVNELISDYEKLGRMLSAMISKANLFCGAAK